uniref:NADH-ubiquinone oxidoreductase chain 2 n=1 Tax=Stenocranus matsumurai TaxID=1291382 RepID=A0A7S4YZS0_9HEMI|nr:NADH dehydrogenase subunit 2 [Stenocranus matsumurai]
MKLNSSKMISLIMILLSTLTSLSTNNWLTMWLMMEINLFMFIPLMSKKKITDQSLKFFIIQSFSSYLLIFSILLSSMTFKPLLIYLIMISLLMKIGMAPFHIWMPEIMNKMAWNECFVLTTILKITPMILINKMLYTKVLIMPMILSLAISSISSINQLNLKKMMAYSSIFNLSWMTPSFLISKWTSIIFMLIYTMLNFKIMNIFKKNNLIYMNQINKLSLKEKMNFNMNMLSISGMPPLAGFFPKWMVLKEMVYKSLTMSIFMILTSMMMTFMYMQLNTFNLTNSSMKKKNTKINISKNLLINDFLIIPLMVLIWMN